MRRAAIQCSLSSHDIQGIPTKKLTVMQFMMKKLCSQVAPESNLWTASVTLLTSKSVKYQSNQTMHEI